MYDGDHVLYDIWEKRGFLNTTKDLEGMGFTVVSFGQSFKDMELIKLALKQRVAYGGHPVLR